MKVEKNSIGEWVCDLTKVLDEEAGLNGTSTLKHYICNSIHDYREKLLFLRVPGGTVGNIKLNDNYVIEQIRIDTDYVVKTYPKDIEDRVSGYIGKKFEIE
ncbi:MAG: hypothetical protein IJE43_02060 [Alphaproteobacteria bacterium]|nr:hypothetical protein [Alphaproteobacteria bacterium]